LIVIDERGKPVDFACIGKIDGQLGCLDCFQGFRIWEFIDIFSSGIIDFYRTVGTHQPPVD
jgi:hypothetical protein